MKRTGLTLIAGVAGEAARAVARRGAGVGRHEALAAITALCTRGQAGARRHGRGRLDGRGYCRGRHVHLAEPSCQKNQEKDVVIFDFKPLFSQVIF